MQDGDNPIVRHRTTLKDIYEAISRFRDLSTTMPVAEVQMFLLVALNEGLSLGELADKADMKTSSASRYLLDLSDKTRRGEAGYGLVNRQPDPDELRRNMYSLTPKGRAMVRKLVGDERR